jgi:hypothetical protein
VKDRALFGVIRVQRVGPAPLHPDGHLHFTIAPESIMSLKPQPIKSGIIRYIRPAVIAAAIVLVFFYIIYRAFNPLYLNHIVLINADYSNDTEINIIINDLGKKIYEQKVILNDFTNSKTLHFNGAWLGGTVILQHNGVVERTGISSYGRYSPTLFIEVHQHAPSRAGWNKIPSFVKDQRNIPPLELNGANNLFIFEIMEHK